jgi:hypothetical protein
MARKRANKNTENTIQEFKKDKIMPLTEVEGGYFQSLINMSNNCGKILQSKAKSEWIIKQLEDKRNDIVKGKIPLPMHITLIPQLMDYEEPDKKKILDIIDEQLKSYKNSLIALNGQLSHQHEEYIEIAIRVKDFMIKKYSGQTSKFVALDPAHRSPTKDEITLFESEFDKLVKEKEGKPNPNYDPKKVAEFKKAKEQAIEMNAALRKKKA